MVDILNQTKIPHMIVLANASNYFDYVAHLVLALTCKHFRLIDSYIQTFFNTIQNMKMCLMIAHSLSDTFYTESQSNPFQSLIQGNSAASRSFLLIAIILIRSLYSTNLIPHSISLISHYICQLVG